MALINAQSLSPQAIYDLAIKWLLAHQASLDSLAKINGWLTGVADADLEAIGADPADLSALRSALADAAAEQQIHYTGAAPASYPAGYVFATSQVRFIGPRLPGG